MTGHPLRPATRLRLGGLLPHQQADRPRAHPLGGAEAPFDPWSCLLWSYSVLARVSPGYSHPRGRSPTSYSPVRRCTQEPKFPFSLDLHVLSTPPAFALSQDQTLHLNGVRKTSFLNIRLRHVFCILALPPGGGSYDYCLAFKELSANSQL